MASLPARSPDQFRVSVIIPHFNMADALERCLISVEAQALDGAVEIIVVDNGSRQMPTEVVATHPDVILLSEPTPGPGPARNAGVAVARAPVLAFIDADCRAGDGWLKAAVEAVEAGGTRAVVGGDVRIDFVDPEHLTPVEAFEAVFAYRQRMYIEKQGFSGTGNLAMHRSVHEAVGPFAGIGIAEDRDWGRRASAIYHPARTDVASLTVKWRRHVSHDWAEHRAAGRPLWRWLLKAALMPASVIVDGGRLLSSERLSGLANKMSGLAVLAKIRLLRCTEMLRVISATGEDAATHWHGDAA
ncbi:MAG: hypothetical protein B7Z50_01565 [Sphingomonadales bacterium 12-62-5]|nr:MAG: hypothetical protein B7Z50_01565 [Sphingomonadales bacterium 12-62-5]